MQTARSQAPATSIIRNGNTPSPLKPVILLVQGSFQLPEAYAKLIAALHTRGFEVVQPRLPSLSDHDSPDFAKRDLTDDSRAIEDEAKRLVDEGKDVLVFMHSYGGLIGSNAISEDLSLQSRSQSGLSGGVFCLFYFAAFILDEGQSVLQTFGESPNNDIKPHVRYTMKGASNTIYHDLPPDEAEYWASKIINQSYAVQMTPITRTAYKYIPSIYVVAGDDHAVPLQYQEMFAATAGAEVKKIQSGQSPQLSQPNELADLIEAAAGETSA
ncbi:hypothetical protein N0V82_005870 [Gnomoniopsis sp. IMI 355080]|nr:hypothetical protein N0V82_005870 [Gnomoniopsis sp. IMI 355080]